MSDPSPPARRTYWLTRLEQAFSRRRIVWLAGVRRVGKTTLAGSIEGARSFDCELPSVRRAIEDVELFLSGQRGRTIVLDEIHRLGDPAAVLKIAADHFPKVRVIATGSSTLAAKAKFRDTLAGRKVEVHLTPLIHRDLVDFQRVDIVRRTLHGGLPEPFLAEEPVPSDYGEWIDAYWAKDLVELFRIERRFSFMRFLELLALQSGGMFEATSFARPCEVSRTTIHNYLEILEETFVVQVLRPHHGGAAREVIAAPKVYVFDTGLVRYFRGDTGMSPSEKGPLFEHLVLNELVAHRGRGTTAYWRDKHGHEVDFVQPESRRGAGGAAAVTAIECKWRADDFNPSNLLSFRGLHPRGRNVVVAADVTVPYDRRHRDLLVRYVGLGDVAAETA